jgi:ADP-dependent NAD(P)H-hydrate dehydratase
MQPFPSVTVVTELPRLPERPADAHKGLFGRVLVVAGSRGMSGAAVLCASAALRGGAGLVYLAVPEDLLPLVAPANPCYLTVPLPGDRAGRLGGSALDPLVERVRASTVAVLGPGLGQSADLGKVVRAVLERTTVPLVLDADALNLLAGHLEWLRAHAGPVVLTPHPGEFARLLGGDTAGVQAQRQGLAARFAVEHGVVLALKGHGTVVTDGQRRYVNTTGNPGMATGGTGDVLAGLIGALLGQGLEAFEAAQLGVYLHGLAGDLARDEVGEVSLIASDLLGALPRAFRAHGRADRAGGKAGG